MAKRKKSRQKVGRPNTKVSPAVRKVLKAVRKMRWVTKVVLCGNKPARRRGGQVRVKFARVNGGLRVSVHSSGSSQDIIVRTTYIDPTIDGIRRAAR